MTEKNQRSKIKDALRAEVLPEDNAEVQAASESAIGGVAFVLFVFGLVLCAIFA